MDVSNTVERSGLMKKKITKYIYLLLVVFVVIIGIRALWLHSNYAIPNQDYFGKQYYEIFYITGISDRLTANQVIKEVEKAFSFVGTESEAEEKFWKLSNYCVIKTTDEELKVENDIKLISANFSGDKGYLWFAYSQEVRNDSGELKSGSSNILARATLEKVNDKWVFTDYLEHP